ncbi:MAG TPA: gamma-glutamyl-phosphate reductase, partial [Solirubrobacteraceae bacterium]|nr:gamma-glutamyl-phosphate reductase [Solirubrobacteraceae bacterium]
MATAVTPVSEICIAAKRASRELARLDTAVKDAALEAIAVALQDRAEEILAANERDMQAGREQEIGDALLDRLQLDHRRLAQ